MIRVAVVIEALGPGGAERLLVDTLRRMDRRRFEMRVYTLFRARRHYAPALEEMGVPETCLDLAGPRDFPAGVRRLAAELARHPADLVHTHLFGANVVGRLAARRRRLPVVSTLHDADYEPVVREGNPGLGVAKHVLLRLVDGLTLRLSRAHTVAVSRYVGDSARHRLGAPEGRTTVIHNAVDTDAFRPATADDRARVRVGLGIAPDGPLVVMVGRFTAQKGHLVLLDAVARLPGGISGPGVQVVLAGDGALRPAIESRVRAHGIGDRVRLLGVRTDVPDLMAAADVVAVPSLHEGFGLVLVEAMSCGVPVLASRTGPIPEIVDDGVTGVLVPPGDPVALAAALGGLLADPALRRAMGARARAAAVARFSLPVMVERLQALYERVAGRSPA